MSAAGSEKSFHFSIYAGTITSSVNADFLVFRKDSDEKIFNILVNHIISDSTSIDLFDRWWVSQLAVAATGGALKTWGVGLRDREGIG